MNLSDLISGIRAGLPPGYGQQGYPGYAPATSMTPQQMANNAAQMMASGILRGRGMPTQQQFDQSFGGYGRGYGMLPTNAPQPGVIMNATDAPQDPGIAAGAPNTPYDPQQISQNIAAFMQGRAMPQPQAPPDINAAGAATQALAGGGDMNAAAAMQSQQRQQDWQRQMQMQRMARMQQMRGGGYGYGGPVSLAGMAYGRRFR